MPERLHAVDHRHAELFEMGEVVLRVENVVPAAAQIRRRAHAVEHQAEPRIVVRGWIVTMPRRLDPLVIDPTPIELGEERLEPVGMLVIDANR